MFRLLATLSPAIAIAPVRRRGRGLGACVAAGLLILGWGGPSESAQASPPLAGDTAVLLVRGPASPAALEAIQRAARDGIGALSPIQTMPVEPLGSVPYRELPLDPMPCDMRATEGLTDASLAVPISVIPSETQGAALPVECANLFPDIEPVPEQSYSFGLETLDPALHEPVVVVSRGGSTMHSWFSSVGSQQGFSYSGGRWMYRDAVGPTVALGNLTANAPLWGSTVPIGGLQLSSGWSGSSETLSEGAFAYSSVVGRLNYTNTEASSGAIDYGATAGSGSVRYGLTPALTLESQWQAAPDMSTRGLGTTYAAGELGTFRLGATRSDFDHINAWRYRFGYSVNLMESLSLAVTNEQIDAGFGDLAVYRGGAAAAPVMRNTLAAGVPLHGGTLTGTYTGTRESGEAVEQRFGLEHSRLVTRDVRLALGADRDVITGDYEMRAGITMPVDAFMRGRWLPW